MSDHERPSTPPQPAPNAPDAPDAPGAPNSPGDDAPRNAAPGKSGAVDHGRPKNPGPKTTGPGNDRKSERPGRTAPQDGRSKGEGRHGGAAGALIELDRELMKLLVRRATLVSRMRGGKDHAATPAAIQAEKAVRIAWETGALAFSKDPRFSRQLFTLLQDIKVMSKEQARQSGSFNLTPPRTAISGSLSGPTSTRAAQMRLVLAAALGLPLRLEKATMTPALLDTVRALSQAGAKISQYSTGTGLGGISLEAGAPPCFADKAVYMGEDRFTLHLMAFLAAGKPGICRFTGGARLMEADLAPLRHALPLFGARLAHVIPRSQGLPANLESSGDIPPLVVVPADLPFEGVCALLLAPLLWDTAVTLNLAALPASVATAALAEVRPLQREAGAEVETHGPHLAFAPSPLTLPEEAPLPLDPVLAAYLLSLPAFAGGGLFLRGPWPARTPEALQAADLLTWAGIELAVDEQGIRAEARGLPFSLPLHGNDLAPGLGPLFLALAAFRHAQGIRSPLPDPAPFPQEDTDKALAREFLSRLGLTWGDGAVVEDRREDIDAALPAWTSPDPYWSLAYAVASLLKPGLQLANPGNVAEAMPGFWAVFNSLPTPLDPARALAEQEAEEKPGDRPARRRIIAD